MTVLSDSARIQTKAAIGEREGKIDNKTKIEIIRDEQRKIQEELDEQKQIEQEKADEVLVDKAKVLSATGAAAAVASAEAVTATATTKTKPIDLAVASSSSSSTAKDGVSLTAKDIEVVSDAIGAIGAEKKTLLVEKEEIKDLKEEIAEYKEDVEELKEVSTDGITRCYGIHLKITLFTFLRSSPKRWTSQPSPNRWHLRIY